MKEKAKVVVRKLRQEATQPGWRRSKAVRWLIGIVLTICIAGLFPRAHSTALSGYSIGSLWTSEDVNAPFAYPIYKDYVRYRQDVKKALDDLYPVYIPDTTARAESLKNFRKAWAKLMELSPIAKKDTLDELGLSDSVKQLGLSRDDWNTLLGALRQSRNPKQLEELEPSIIKLIGDLESNSMITQGTTEESTVSNSNFFSLRVHPQQETILNRDSLMTLEGAQNRLFAAIDQRVKHESELSKPITKLAASALLPNVLYSQRLTEESRLAIEDRVPRTDGIVPSTLR